MKSYTRVLSAGLGVVAFTLPTAVLAGHIRAGLWEVTSHLSMHNLEAMLPPDELARMKASGMKMPNFNNNANTFRHCVTPAEAANDKPPPIRKDRDCTMSNVVYNAHSFSGDMVCTGEMQGQGHAEVTFADDQHYSGHTAFSASRNGRSMDMGSTFEARWISADCGSEQ